MRLGLIFGLYGALQYGNAAAQDSSLMSSIQSSGVDQKLYCEQPRGYDESFGLPTHGRLRNGVAIESTACLESMSTNHFGTQEIADLLQDTACHMFEQTGARLRVDDVSQYGGGKFRPHKSHQNGLDVDVGHFYAGERYIKNSTGSISGNSETMAVTWEFVRTLGNHSTGIEYIFWSPRNIQNLKRYVVQSIGKEEWDQYGSVFHPERRHTRHMHIRILKPRQGMAVAARAGERNKQRLD